MEKNECDTKSRVIAKALELIKKDGYEKVTINDICEAAQISKNTFYYYFKSKTDLLLSFKDMPREIRASRLASIINAENYFEQYWQLIEPSIDFIDSSEPEIIKQIYITSINNKEKAFKKPHRDERSELEVAIIKKAQKAGEIRNNSDAFELMHSAYIQIFGTGLVWCSHYHEKNESYKSVIRGFLEVLFDLAPELRKAKNFLNV